MPQNATIYSRMTDDQANRMLAAMLKAKGLAGGWQRLAQRITETTGERVSAQAVWKWSMGISAERALDVERALNGMIRRQDLRPDLYEGMEFDDANGAPVSAPARNRT